MGLSRSTFYDAPAAHLDDAEIVSRMRTICDEFETYGYRRVATEMALHVLAYNLIRVLNIMGPGRLIAALRT